MKTLTISFLLFISFFSIQAQELAGRKIIQGSLAVNINSTEIQAVNSYGASVLYGKIRENNTYLAWGGTFTANTNRLDPSNINEQRFQVGPAVEFGKFISLVDRLYLAPNLGGAARAAFGKSEGVHVSAYATPLRFMYHFSNNFMLSASLGAASVSFSQIDKNTKIQLNGSLTNSTGFGVFYTFK